VAASVLLVAALLAPKVSLALATALGNGFTSVIICSGGGLTRVMLSADGKVIEDVSERWVGSHCVLNDDDTSRLARAWRRLEWPRLAPMSSNGPSAASVPRLPPWPAASNRGPPSV